MNRYPLTLIVLSLFLLSCQNDDPFNGREIEEVLLSTGWKLEKYIYYFHDGSTAERDTLVLTMIRTDSMKDTRAVYTERWLKFENDTFAVTAYNYDWYGRPKGEPEWKLERDSLTSVSGATWGTGGDLKLYMNPGGERPVWIDVRDQNNLILRDAYQIETEEYSCTDELSIIYTFGEFPAESPDYVDAHYRSASPEEGPYWSPDWQFWQW